MNETGETSKDVLIGKRKLSCLSCGDSEDKNATKTIVGLGRYAKNDDTIGNNFKFLNNHGREVELKNH